MKELNTELYERTNCPLCNSSQHTVTTSQFTPFIINECSECTMNYMSPRPTEQEMIKIYSSPQYFDGDNSFGYSDTNYKLQEKALYLTFKKLLKKILKHKNRGSFLEIGCGNGYLAKEAQKYYKNVHCTDFSSSIEKKSQDFSDGFFLGGIENIPQSNTYDIIVANHVIEHVYHPNTFVENAYNILSHKGRLLLSTPKMKSFWWYLMKDKWPSYKIPEHILYFSKDNLIHLMEKAGFKNFKTVPYLHAFPLELILN